MPPWWKDAWDKMTGKDREKGPKPKEPKPTPPDPTPPPAEPEPPVAPEPDPPAEPDPPTRPEPIPVPPPTTVSGLIFSADPAKGINQWCTANKHSAVPVGIEKAPDGTLAFRSEIQDGKMIYSSSRSEWANGPTTDCKDWWHFKPGMETWTTVPIFLRDDFPKYDKWSLVTQWKESHGGTPPQQIGLQREAFNIRGAGSVSPRPNLPMGPIARGRWIKFEIGHFWSPDASKGWVEGWRDGVRVLPRTTLKTIENTTPLFLSVGHYRDVDNTGTAVLWVGKVEVRTARSA